MADSDLCLLCPSGAGGSPRGGGEADASHGRTKTADHASLSSRRRASGTQKRGELFLAVRLTIGLFHNDYYLTTSATCRNTTLSL